MKRHSYPDLIYSEAFYSFETNLGIPSQTRKTPFRPHQKLMFRSYGESMMDLDYSTILKRLGPHPISHEARREIREMAAKIAKLEAALSRIIDMAPDDKDSGAACVEIAEKALND